MADGTSIRVIASGLHHPEGVAHAPSTGLVCGSDHGQLVAVDPTSGKATVLGELPGAMFLGVCVDGSGGVIACELSERRVVRWHDGSFHTLPAPEGGWRHPNALCFLADGRLVVSDSGRWRDRSGRLVVVDDGGALVLATDPLAFANGVAADGEGRLWVIESADPAVSCFELDGEAARLVVRHPLPGTVPDGVAALADGSVVVACYRPDRLLRVGATVDVLADDPTGLRLAGPTNVALHGEDLRRIAVACFGGYHLAEVDSPVPGVPVHRPAWR